MPIVKAIPLFKGGSLPTMTLNGETITGVVQKGVEAFRGIPFALPPVGDLRFKPPVPFNGSLEGFQATEWGNSCISFSPFKSFDVLGKIARHVPGFAVPSLLDVPKVGVMSEDCLTVNVWRPQGVTQGDDLPVMVWIYGGAFQWGSSPAYAGDPFVKTSMNINQPIIFVSIPYRLGPWGFLGGNAIQEEGSGNAGLLDQRLALQWIQDNIADFGGDPSKVTLIGESAGAMSIATQLIAYGGDHTYKGKPLFRGAIFQSGGVLPVAAVDSNKPQRLFRKLGEEIGCDSTFEDKDMLECLRDAPAGSIRGFVDRSSSNFFNLFNTNELFFGFGPRVDGNFIPEYAFDAVRKGKVAEVPYITGNQEDEGTLFSFGLFESLKSREDTDGALDELLEYGDKDQIQKFLSLYPDDPSQGSPYRTGDRWATQNQTKRVASILTDTLFHIPRRLHLENTPKKVNKWVYTSDALHGTSPFGTFHANDCLWEFTSTSAVPATAYRNYFITFANNLDPNPGSGLPPWPKYDDKTRKTINIGLREISESVDVFPQEGREDAIRFAMDNDFLAM